MNTLWNKLWCVILSLAILVNLLPVSALASETTLEQVVAQHWVEDPPVKATDEASQPLEIISEDTSKRGEYYKEFVLSNGLRMASMYAEPVHYSEDGQWKEIDNTLKLASGAYTNTAGKWKVSFPQQLTKDKAVTITKDGYTLSFFMAGELYQETTSLIRAALGTVTQEQPVQLQSFRTATAQLQAVQPLESEEDTLYPQVPIEKSHARLTYGNVSNGTDIVYDLKGNQVKESIIIDAYSAKLQGYRYTLNVGELSPVLTDSGEIQLYDRDNSQIVMVMPAPFLVDDAGEYCYDVKLTLTGSGSQYTLTYHLPQQWLADAQRQWPVVLDPVVEADITRTNIRDVSVYEQNTPNDHNSGVLDVGHNTTYGVMRSFLKYQNLPALSSSDVVVYARLDLLKPNDNSTSNPIEIHKVLNTWESETMTWSNQPNFNPLVEDFSIVEDTGYYSWCITDVVRGWYEGENTGLMLKAPAWVETTTSTTSYRKQFMSSDYSEYVRPILSIVFRNNNGLESYWDYTPSSAGRAGTGYINNYTGNLVWTHNDIGFGGNRMPVSISHIYNANDCTNNDFGLGYGWRTNYNQRAYKANLTNATTEYYVWEDADGTDHYFYYDKEVKKYVDEDNLGLTMTLNSSKLPEKITDKNGNISYFDAQGRLYKLENNQATPSSIQITFRSATDKRINTITDGAGHVYQFGYYNNFVNRISYYGSGTTEISYIAINYTNSCPIKITYQDSTENSPKYSQFTYSSKRLLLTAQDIDGYKLSYTYTTQGTGKPSRVKTVTETHNGKTGSSLTLTYAHNQTTFTDNLGNVQIKQFNNWGNTTAIQDDEGRAQFANFASDDPSESGKANQLLLSSKLQNTVGNMLSNSSFEGTNVWSAINATSSLCTTQAYLGSKSMQFAKEGSSTTGYVTTGACTAEAGATYTFSAYIKTGPNASAYLTVGPDTSIVSETLPAEHGWTRLQVSYTNTGSSDVMISAKVLTKTAGKVYVDCVQLEKAETASRYNIIENGDFRFGSNDWIMSEYCDSTEAPVTLSVAYSAPAAELNRTAFRIVGDPSHKLRIRQEVPLSGVKGDTFVLAGWARGDGTPMTEFTSDVRRFTLRGTFLYTDGTTKECEFHFNPDVGAENIWQYAAGVMVAEKAFSGIKIQVLYDYGANTIYFDGIQLYKEEFGNSYTYDEEGNVTSVKDLQGKTTTYEYASNKTDLLKVIQDNKAKVTYTYDNYHNVKTATTETGLVYEFTYDAYGNNTSVSIKYGSGTITSTATYSTDGNRLVSTTDALGNTTTYGYHPETNVLEWVQYPEDTPETRTEYTYDRMYRTAQAELTTDTGLNLSAEYTYDNDLLTSITTASTTYNFTYGDFALRDSIAVGNQILASYDYQEGTNWLERLDYGNEDYVQYTYDNQGRVTQQSYEDGAYVTYKYDNSGALAKVYDSQTGTTSTYYYDFTDRMMKYVEKSSTGTHSVGYEYDNINNLTALVETINGVERKTSYTYDGDNRPTSITAGNSVLNYSYDDFGRVSSLTTNHDGTPFATKTYTYKVNANGKPTNQVSSVTISDAEGHPYYTYTYTYDQNGNITGISDGTYTTSYAYDSANQLIREDNQEAGTTTVWTYDNAGNILTRTVYPYTTGAVGEGTQTSYYYTDTQWGDLLKSYDKRPIMRDSIGNPTNDFVWRYTWQHGRQLASMTKLDGSAQWNYTYNADGLRTQRIKTVTDPDTGETISDRIYNYTYNGDKLTHMTVDGHTMYFTYDASGVPLTMVYDGNKFYYVTNLQGDVISIINGNGQEFVRYTYDAWGKLLSADGSATNLRFYNPLRYRGYVYDEETGLYYLQSRYYNPEMGRFINADAFPSTGQGVLGNNMFAYCGNNPVSREDDGGEFWNIVIGAAVGGLVSGITAAIDSYVSTGSIDWGKVGISAAVGAISGGIAATGLGAIAQAGITAAVSATGSIATDIYERSKSSAKEKITVKEVAKMTLRAGCNAAIGFAGSLFGTAAGKIVSGSLEAKGASMVFRGKIGPASLTKAQAQHMVTQGKTVINTARGISSVVGTLFTWPTSTALSLNIPN